MTIRLFFFNIRNYLQSRARCRKEISPFRWAGLPLQLRVGDQVINWGEATFTSGINGLQNRADLIARNTPGVEVKEILLPSGALYGQLDLTPAVTFEAYYQYEWKRVGLPPVGSYFSTNDLFGGDGLLREGAGHLGGA